MKSGAYPASRMKPMYQARKKIVAGRTNLRRAAMSSRNSGERSISSQSTRGCGADVPSPSRSVVPIRTYPGAPGTMRGPVDLERHLAATAAAGGAALADRPLRCAERLGQPAAELAGRQARTALPHAHHLVATTLRTVRQPREEERKNEQHDAERDDSGDDHGGAIPRARRPHAAMDAMAAKLARDDRAAAPRHRHALRRAAARGRVAAGIARGRRRRDVRHEVHGRR